MFEAVRILENVQNPFTLRGFGNEALCAPFLSWPFSASEKGCTVLWFGQFSKVNKTNKGSEPV